MRFEKGGSSLIAYTLSKHGIVPKATHEMKNGGLLYKALAAAYFESNLPHCFLQLFPFLSAAASI